MARKRRKIHVVDRLATSFRAVFPEEDNIPVRVECGEVDDGGLADDRKMRKSGVWRGKIGKLAIGTIEVREARAGELCNRVINSDASIASSSIVAVTSTADVIVPIIKLTDTTLVIFDSVVSQSNPRTRRCRRPTSDSQTATGFLRGLRNCDGGDHMGCVKQTNLSGIEVIS